MSVSPDRWSRGGSPAGSDGPPQDDWVFEGSPLYGEVAYETRFTEERVVEGSPLYDETVYATLFTDGPCTAYTLLGHSSAYRAGFSGVLSAHFSSQGPGY